MISDEAREQKRIAGRKGGLARVPKGFAKNPNVRAISKKGLDARYKKQS